MVLVICVFGKKFESETQQLVAYHTRIRWQAPERTIWMDGREHPPEYAAHTWQGFFYRALGRQCSRGENYPSQTGSGLVETVSLAVMCLNLQNIFSGTVTI